MNLIGKRVRVKPGGDYRPTHYGVSGLVTETYSVAGEAYRVALDTGTEPYFYTDELIVLGGRHAGEPHPQNFEGPLPKNDIQAENAIEDAEGYGWYAGPADHQAELNAWREHRDAL